jgi:hypothetical protein
MLLPLSASNPVTGRINISKYFAECAIDHGIKGRSGENFLNRVSVATTCCIQRITEGKRVCKRPYCNRLPHRNSDGGTD